MLKVNSCPEKKCKIKFPTECKNHDTLKIIHVGDLKKKENVNT